MSTLYLFGMGPGNAGYLVPEAIACMKKAGHVIGAKRVLPELEKLAGGQVICYPMGKIAETLKQIDAMLTQHDVALAVSGDPLFYSLLKTIQKSEYAKKWDIKIIPGIGSLQMLGAAIGKSTENAAMISVHGREVKRGKIALTITEHEKTFLLCSKEQGPAWIADILLEYHLEHAKMYIGENLSYENETITAGSPKEIAKKEFESLCVLCVENEKPQKISTKSLLLDEDFVRGKTPMTKEEIRAILIQKMKLMPESVVWDIGAGTGSISIECARQCPYGEVHAVERNKEALELIQKNKEKFETENLTIYDGKAMEVIETLPVPDVVFIGGSGGELEDIMNYIQSLNQSIRVVVTAVTIETLGQCQQCMEKFDENYNMTQVTAGRSRKIGSYHIMDVNNPVTIFEGISH